jgi:hypothetical protein
MKVEVAQIWSRCPVAGGYCCHIPTYYTDPQTFRLELPGSDLMRKGEYLNHIKRK